MNQQSPDYWLSHPEELGGQPKKTIGKYVKQNGILVPTIFDTLEEARNSGVSILLRSEHPQDYDGVSGLLRSFEYPDVHNQNFLQGCKTIEDAIKECLELSKDYIIGVSSKLFPTDKQEAEFIGKSSYSAWEKISGYGYNRTIIADSCVAGRYHIITSRNRKIFYSYVIVDSGKIVKQFHSPLPEELYEGINGLITTYETIRNLEKFNPKHCPIMEFQTYDGSDYFLQYHRTRDFEPAKFTLERALEEGESEVVFVRGKTSPTGETFSVTIFPEREYPNEHESSFVTTDGVFESAWSLTRELSVFGIPKIRLERGALPNHTVISCLFKPRITVIFPIEYVLKDNEVTGEDESRGYLPREPILRGGESIVDFFDEDCKGKHPRINIRVISDGRRAYVKRV